MKGIRIVAGIVSLIVVVAFLFLFVMPLLAAPHFAFPSTSQVDSATGAGNYTASSVISSSTTGPNVPSGAVKMEGRYFNNSAGSLQFVIMEFKSTTLANKEYLNLSTIFSPILKASGGSMQNVTYKGASVVVVDFQGHSGIAFGKIGDYIFAVVNNNLSSSSSLNPSVSTMKTLIELEVNAMVS
jgi:hypothetical protein